MNLKFKNVTSIVIQLACLTSTLPSVAQTKPRWAQKGVKAMNHDHFNDTYEFIHAES